MLQFLTEWELHFSSINLLTFWDGRNFHRHKAHYYKSQVGALTITQRKLYKHSPVTQFSTKVFGTWKPKIQGGWDGGRGKGNTVSNYFSSKLTRKKGDCFKLKHTGRIGKQDNQGQ